MTLEAARGADGRHVVSRVAVGRFDTIVLDCPDPLALATFYAGLLGQQIAEDGSDEWESLTGDGSGISLAFQRAENYVAPTWPDGPPQQLHLDLTVDDLVVAHAAAVTLGATPLRPTTAPDPELEVTTGFRVYADPAGHPFCLCR